MTLSSIVKLAFPTFVLIILYNRMSAMGLGSDILDMRFFYTSQEAAHYFLNLSPEKAQSYFSHELTDLAFLTSYTALSFFGVEIFFSKKSNLKWLALIPGLFDLCETCGILVTLKMGPPFNAISWLGIATLLKWTTGAVFFILFFGRAIWATTLVRKKKI